MNFAQFICKFPLTGRLLGPLGRQRASHFYRHFKPYLTRGETVLDLGAGMGHLSDLLRHQGFEVTPVDVVDLSLVKEIKPQIYDGLHLPYTTKQFDAVIICTVLHHTPKPEKVLTEAARVAKKVILVEEIYHNDLQKLITFFFDSLSNFQFRHHPHTNKTDRKWRDTFKKLHLDLQKASYFTTYTIFQSVAYLLKTESKSS